MPIDNDSRQAFVRAFVLERRVDGYRATPEVLRDERTIPLYDGVALLDAVTAEIARAHVFFCARAPRPHAQIAAALLGAEDVDLGGTVQTSPAGQMSASRILAHLVSLDLGVTPEVAGSIGRRVSVLLLNRDIAVAAKARPARPQRRDVTPPPIYKVPGTIVRAPGPEAIPFAPPAVTPEPNVVTIRGRGAEGTALWPTHGFCVVVDAATHPMLVLTRFEPLGVEVARPEMWRPTQAPAPTVPPDETLDEDPLPTGTGSPAPARKREVIGYSRVIESMRFAPPGVTVLPRGAVVELVKPSGADRSRIERAKRNRDMELVAVRWELVSVVPKEHLRAARMEDWLAQEERGHPWLLEA